MAGSAKGKAENLKGLKNRLAAAEDALEAIRTGHVDALVVSRDGSERLLTLSGAENGYRVFVEAMTEGAVTVGGDGTILYCNRGFAEIAGRALDHLIGTPFRSHVATAHLDAFEAAIVRSEEAPSRVEIALRSDSGGEVPVYLSITSFVEFGSRALCMVVTDLREQKRQEQIVATEKLSKTLVEQALEAIAVCDPTGRIILASQTLHKLCACNPLFQRFDDVLRLETQHRGRTVPLTLPMILSGPRLRAVEVLAAPPGRSDMCQMLLSAGPIQLPGDSGTGCVLSLFDIEERKRAEEALRQSEKLAATGRLAATIAHEINNPLEAVTNLLYLCANAPGMEPQMVDYLRLAESELSRVAHITRQTLTFHRLSPHPEPVRLAEIVESVLYLYERQLMAKRVEVMREFENEQPVMGYANELRQVVSNLFTNAIEACPAGGKLRVRLYRSHEFHNGHVPGIRLVVGDTGSGIPRTHARHIFEPFYTTKGAKGSGLGLWVSQGIIAKHGGTIRMRSSTLPQKSGTVFSVFVPYTSSETEAAGKAS